MVYLILLVLSVGFLPQKSIPSPKSLYTYEWQEVFFESDFTENDRYVILDGNGYYRTKEERIWITAFDTLPITIKIIEPINDTIKLIEKLNYRAIPDPYFDNAWDTLKIGEKPTPLTKQQTKAFRNYSKSQIYQLLQQKSPPFSVQSVYGDPFNQDSLINKVTLINFWFYGCLPCMAEIPALNEVAEYYKDNPKVQLISFFRDSMYVDEVGIPQFQSNGSSIKNGVIQSKKHYPVDHNFTQMPNTKKECDAFNIIAYPTNILIDTNGIVQEIFMGANAEIKGNSYLKNKFIRKIDNLLEAFE